MAMTMLRSSNLQTVPVSFTLNGKLQELDAEPHELLLDVIRDRLGLTGAKRSCDVQVCGACTLLVDGRPVSACTTLAFEVRGKSVLTIEGLDEIPDPTEKELKHFMHGNLCRCTGYKKIIESIMAAATVMRKTS